MIAVRWTVSNADEALQIEAHLLTPHSDLQLSSAHLVAVSNESLLEIERILVHGGNQVLVECTIVLQLHKDLPVGVRPNVSVELQALDEVGVSVGIVAFDGGDSECTSDRPAAPCATLDRPTPTNLPASG
jgi:hypothetical protein